MPGTKSTSSRSAKGARREAPAADDAKPADARTLRERYEDVRARVAAAAVRSGRRAEDVLLVAVTKYAPMAAVVYKRGEEPRSRTSASSSSWATSTSARTACSSSSSARR